MQKNVFICNTQGEGLPYKKGRDAPRKVKIKPLKETNLGVAQAFLAPKVNVYFYVSSRATLEETFTAATYDGVFPRTP